MKFNKLLYCAGLVAMAAVSSCKKDSQNGGFENTGNFTDKDGPLKSFASFPIGFAVEYPLATTNTAYWNTIKGDAGWITFGNELKNNFVLKADGTYDFTRADAFYDLATAAGIQVFGHTLVWHSQQQSAYYNSQIGVTGGGSGPTNLLPNGGFETSATGTFPFANWSSYNLSTGSSWSAATGADIRSGTSALKVVVGVDNAGRQFTVQGASALFATTPGTSYKVSYYVKAANAASAAIRFSTQNDAGGGANYQGDQNVTTGYSLVEWTFVANSAQTRILMDLGAKANTYFFDDITVTDATVVAPPSGAQLAVKVDALMKSHIETVLNRYKGKIKAWDVINEPFSDGGALRDNTNTPAGNGIFVWQNYLGADYAIKAFQYARAVDPTADLYMNDYNLESNATKLTNFVNMAKAAKAANSGITGVGTQMHMLVTTPYANIITMFQQLAATGLKVRISELDVRINPGGANPTANYVPTEIDYRNQAAMYKFVVAAYLKYVPAAQRGGITIWGVDDTTSWLNTSTNVTANKLDYPLLYDKSFGKKQAYAGVKQGLQGNGENL